MRDLVSSELGVGEGDKLSKAREESSLGQGPRGLFHALPADELLRPLDMVSLLSIQDPAVVVVVVVVVP